MNNNQEPDIRLNIGTLTINGLSLSKNDAAVVKTSLESELKRLIGKTFVSRESMKPDDAVRTIAPPINLRQGQSAQHIGRVIAASVHGGLRQ